MTIKKKKFILRRMKRRKKNKKKFNIIAYKIKCKLYVKFK